MTQRPAKELGRRVHVGTSVVDFIESETYP